jgi:hypothetical protein
MIFDNSYFDNYTVNEDGYIVVQEGGGVGWVILILLI